MGKTPSVRLGSEFIGMLMMAPFFIATYRYHKQAIHHDVKNRVLSKNHDKKALKSSFISNVNKFCHKVGYGLGTPFDRVLSLLLFTPVYKLAGLLQWKALQHSIENVTRNVRARLGKGLTGLASLLHFPLFQVSLCLLAGACCLLNSMFMPIFVVLASAFGSEHSIFYLSFEAFKGRKQLPTSRMKDDKEVDGLLLDFPNNIVVAHCFSNDPFENYVANVVAKAVNENLYVSDHEVKKNNRPKKVVSSRPKDLEEARYFRLGQAFVLGQAEGRKSEFEKNMNAQIKPRPPKQEKTHEYKSGTFTLLPFYDLDKQPKLATKDLAKRRSEFYKSTQDSTHEPKLTRS